ncbi:MAG: carbohydrate-binding domain-containing protein [Clostridia bacterium]|nr:carbohydrate-binding domain-containing protein [Clostridia bacterium]
MKRRIALLMAMLLVALVFASCNGNNPPPTPPSTGSESTGSEQTTGGPGGDLVVDPENPGNVDITPPVVDYDTPSALDELEGAINVFDDTTYTEKSTIYDYNQATLVDVSKDANNASYPISEGGIYRITGTSANGSIYIKAADQDVTLVLAGVNLTSKFSAPAIYAEDCSSVTIILADGTENYLADGEKNGETGVIRVRNCNLTMDGRGSLTIVSSHKHGIANTKTLTVNGGTYNITTPNDEGHALYGKQGLTINSGKFTINAGKSGFKSGDDTVGEEEVGHITINYTYADITCGTNAINCYGPVTINGGIIKANAKSGNGIDASENILIQAATVAINSQKSAITTDLDVIIEEGTSLKLETTRNGISAKNVTLSTSSVVYISTQAMYVKYVPEEGETTPPDRFVKIDGVYVEYNEEEHGTKTTYTRNNCKGIKADEKVTITAGIIGIDSYEDSINCADLEISGGTIYVSTTGDGVEANNVTIDGEYTALTILNSQKGIKGSSSVVVNNGILTVNAVTDSINSNSTEIKGGTLYLFDKIDKGKTGSTTVTGGIVIMLSTTASPQLTSGSQGYLSRSLTKKDLCVFGADVRIKVGNNVVILKLPKDYTEKLAIYYSASSLSGGLSVEYGVCENGNKVNAYVSKGGDFTVIDSEVIE